MEERQLAEGCLRGDNAARRELYCRYAARLLGIAIRYLGDRAAAEDLLHDAFLKIYASLGKFTWRGNGSLRGWMERVTVNLALDRLRRSSRLRTVEAGDRLAELADEEPPGCDEVQAVPREVLLRMIAELPDGYRTVFNLFCVEELSHREIARQLGINEHSSASQLSRAKAILAKKIKAYVKSRA